VIILSSIFLIQAQCVNKRSSPVSSAISINVHYISDSKYINGSNRIPLNKVYFIKLNKKNNNLYTQTNIRIGRIIGKNIYLLNAEPGKYAAIGGQRLDEERATRTSNASEKSIIYFFPKNMIPLTVVNIGTSDFKHMGNFIIDDKGEPRISEMLKIRNADSAQIHYCRLIRPDSADPSKSSCLLGCLASYLLFLIPNSTDEDETVYAAKMISQDKSRKARKEALRRALRDLSGTEWVTLIKKIHRRL